MYETHEQFNDSFERACLEMDKRKHAEQQAQMDPFYICMISTLRRLERAPLKFCYEIRQIFRMRDYIEKHRFVPDSYRRIIQQYRHMAE